MPDINYSPKIIGERIRTQRKAHNLTQEQLCEKINIGRTKLSNCESASENEFEKILDLDILLRMCNLFDCELGYLLGEHEEKTRICADIHKEIGLTEEAINKLKEKVNISERAFKKYGTKKVWADEELMFISKFILECKSISDSILDIIITQKKVTQLPHDENYALLKDIFDKTYSRFDFKSLGASFNESLFYDTLEEELEYKFNNPEQLKERSEEANWMLQQVIDNGIYKEIDGKFIQISFDEAERFKEQLLNPNIDIESYMLERYQDVYHYLKLEKEGFERETKMIMFSISDIFLDIVKDFINQNE